MNKVPVFETVSRSFAFAFGRYFSILGAVWLPLLLLFACEYFVLVPLLKNIGVFIQFVSAHPKSPPPPEMMALLQSRYTGALNLVTYLISAWIVIGVTKEALGVRTGPKFVYVSVGNAELLYLASVLVLAGLAIAAVLVIAIAAVVVVVIGAALGYGGAFSALDAPTQAMLAVSAGAVLVIAIVGAIIYFAIRLTFLMAPATVAENRFGLWRSWELSKGNFWRLFAVSLLMGLIFLVFEVVVGSILIVPAVLAIARQFPHMSSDNIQAAIDLGAQTAKPYLAFAVLIVLAVIPIFYGLSCGASAFAYRALVPSDDK